MKLEPFLLDRWLQRKSAPSSDIRWDLASSTGPPLTVGELLDLAGASDSLAQLLDTHLTYTQAEGSSALREGIAEFEGVEPDDVIITTGASEALLIQLFVAAEPHANVVLPMPDFPAISAVARGVGLEVRTYPLDRLEHFRLDPERVCALIDANTRMVLVISPHNPTGIVADDAVLVEVHDYCVERGIRFVCDQVSHPINYQRAARSAATLPGTTVVGDFSKALCLSGLRVGWIVERDARRREQCLDARMYFTISNAVLSEALAGVAMRARAAVLARAQQIASRNLSLLDALLGRHQQLFGWVRPQGGFVGFPWLLDGVDSSGFCEDLASKGVLVVPGRCFGAPEHFRIGFGATETVFAEGLEHFDSYVSSTAHALAR